ncbi:MAG: class I SAM-dependent methyltransferase [Bacteroidetes bacterium]|nr:class I SAM-dependent methyltransferase [Bacteroidota bacterium]
MFFRKFLPGNLKRKIHKKIYNNYQERAQERGVKIRFINLGYADSPGYPGDRIKGNDFNDREYDNAQLYFQLLKEIDLRNKDVLEIGCGAGGGCELIAEHFLPKSIAGIDLSDGLINENKKKYKNQKIIFSQGNAEQLPYADNSMDIVINVESSHCYPSRQSFVRETKRVLRPGGFFCYADLMDQKDMIQMEEYTKENFGVMVKRNISRNVVLAIDKLKTRKDVSRKKNDRWFLTRVLRNIFFVTPDSDSYKKLQQGKVIYVMIVARKPDN